MAISGQLQIQGSSGSITAGTPVNFTLTITNTGTSAVNVSQLNLAATSNGVPYPGATFGVPTSRGLSSIAAGGGQLVYSFGAVFRTPQGSAENAAAPTGASSTGVVVTATVFGDDNSVTAISETITPTQLGAAAPAAAGQFLFASPLNSYNYYLF